MNGEGQVFQRKWHTVAEVAQMLGYGLTKTKMLVITGELRSLKDGRSRRILPEWVDEYVARRAAEAEAPFGRWSA
jgi:excisionase family DNA binding protein